MDDIDVLKQRAGKVLRIQELKKEIRAALDEGVAAAENRNLVQAKMLFQEVWAMEEVRTSSDEAEIVGALFKAGQAAEKSKNRKQAVAFYEATLDFDEDNKNARARLAAISRRRTMIWIGWGIGITIVLVIFLSWLRGVVGLSSEACNATGNVACTPTPTLTPTLTPTFTPTNTPTFTPTNTPTPTPTNTPTSTPTNTPTYTPTPSMTPTPIPYIGEIVGGGTVYVYANASGDAKSVAYTMPSGSQVYLCAYSGSLDDPSGSRYQVKLGYCHSNDVLGWINASRIRIMSPLDAAFSESLVTPAALIPPTSTPGG